jgi:pyruvate dehydrogenase E2 component (dihydrolipoamide acetyltransferase)
MAEVILMPRLSDTMTEGVIASWNKNVGDTVKKGDLLAEIETDKATLELESYQNGVLLHIGAGKGGKLQVNDLLAIIGKANEDINALINGSLVSSEKQVDSEVEKKNKPNETQETRNEPTTNYAAMEEVVLMPRLSDTMTEGVVAGWQKNVGDIVKKGEVLADIETDKATMELESYKDGILLYQGAKAGEKILVNELLCIIGKKELNIDEIVVGIKNGGQSTINSQPILEPKNEQQETKSKHNEQQETRNEIVNKGRIFISPLAKKIATEKGLDLKYIKGTGDNGRIVKSDVENQLANVPMSQLANENTTREQQETRNDFEDVPVSQMRKVIAKRLSESLFTAPHFYLTMSIDMDAAVAARTKLNEGGKTKISFNDMVLKATAMSLKQHPKVNSSWMGDFIRYNNNINIGVAVAVEEGLLVPVVKNADALSFTQIGTRVKDFAQKAKDKKLQPTDWEGNTFTISNLGMFGIDEFTAIINPPDSCILAVGGISQIPVVKNGAIVIGNVMKVTLSCDHRVVDGATGSAFLQTLKSLLEEPLRMLA